MAELSGLMATSEGVREMVLVHDIGKQIKFSHILRFLHTHTDKLTVGVDSKVVGLDTKGIFEVGRFSTKVVELDTETFFGLYWLFNVGLTRCPLA